jgi:hypothetical protein
VRRAIPLLLVLVLLLAGCGKSKPKAATTTATNPAATAGPATVLGKGAKVLYQSSGWAVVVDGADAVAAHLVQGKWRADRAGKVQVEILGSTGPQAPTPQVAAQLISKTPLVESSIWIDGVAVQVKGGGSPTRGTIYGAPAAPLFPGKHLEVAYARTATDGTAVARVFTVVSK